MLRLRSFGYGCRYAHINNKKRCVILKKQFRGYAGRVNYYIYVFFKFVLQTRDVTDTKF